MKLILGVLLLLGLSLPVFEAPTPASAEEIPAASIVLDAASGLPQPDVVDALERDDELLALTDRGLYRYDGLQWSGPEIGDSLRWVLERDGRAWIGGARGVWREDAGGSFASLPGAPGGQRCALLTRDGRLFAGGDKGLDVHEGGHWRPLFDDAVVLCLEEHPRWGVLAGTLGHGLRLHVDTDSMRSMRCPGAGVRDTLPGDIVHSLRVLEDGTLRLATSFTDLDSRYVSHRHLRDRGLVSERDPRTYLRAAVSDWDGRHWTVRPLLQDYRRDERTPSLRIGRVAAGELDDDGHEEWILSVDSGRRLHPRGLIRIDARTGRTEGFLERAGRLFVLPARTGDGKLLLAGMEEGSDHGNAFGTRRDDANFSVVADLDLRILREDRVDFSGWIPVLSIAEPSFSELPESGLLVGASPNAALNAIEIYRFDPASLRWLPLAPREAASSSAEKIQGPKSGDVGLLLTPRSEPRRWRWIDPESGSLLAEVDEDSFEALHDETVSWFGGCARLAGEIGALASTQDSMVFLGSTGRSAALFSLTGATRNGPIRALGPSPLSDETLPWFVGTNPTTGERWYGRFEGSSPRPPSARVTDAIPLEFSLWPSGKVWAEWPSLESARSLRWDIGPLPPGPSPPPPEGSNSDLFFFRASSGDLRVVLSTPEDGALPVLDARGRRVGSMPLPPVLARAFRERQAESRAGKPSPTPRPFFLRGARIYRHGHPAFTWFDSGRHPWRFVVGEPVTGSWDPVIEVDLGYTDLGANGVTALGPRGQWWGTERGLRDAGDPHRRWSSERVRRLRDARRGGLLEVGAGGVRVWRSRPAPLLEGIDDVARGHGELVAVNRRMSWFVRGDSLESDLLNPTAPETHHVQLLRIDESLLVQHITPDRFGSVPVDPHDRTPSRRLGQYELFIDGTVRVVRTLHRLPPDDLLVGTDWGLRLLHGESGEVRDLFDRFIPVRTLLGDSTRAWAADAEGRVWRFDRRDDRLLERPALAHEPERAVQEFVGHPRRAFARTPRGVEAWDLVAEEMSGRWELPDTLSALDLEVREDGDDDPAIEIWLGTTGGVWWTDGTHSLRPFEHSLFGEHAVERVIVTDSTVVVLSEGRLFRRPRIPAAPADLQAWRWSLTEGRTLHVGAWGRGRVELCGIEVQEGRSRPRVLRGTPHPDGTLTVDLGEAPPGRQRLRVRALDDWGRPLGEETELERIRRTPSAHWAAASLLIPSLLVGVWAFDPRRRYLWLLAALGLSTAFFYCGHEVYCHQLPWQSSVSLAGGLVAAGLVLRWRERLRRIPPARARQRLDDLLRGFRHRGGGVNPVDEWLLLTRNLDLLARDFEVDDDRLVRVLEDVLEATGPMARELDRLALYAELEPTLLRRFSHRLQEMRDLAASLIEDAWRRREWAAHPDQRLATVELCTSFLGSVESVSELVRRHSGLDLAVVLPAYAERVRQRHGIECTLDMPRSLPRVAVSEPMLNEVLENLEGNAIRAMQGVATLRIHLSARLARPEMVRLFFDDEGPGIAPELRAQVLESGFSTTGSTGFGLARCQQLVRDWGGELRLESAPGGGLRVAIELPVLATRAQRGKRSRGED